MNKLNKNIEVINKDLWAVRFSFLPFISEIAYTPDDEVPIHEDSGRITNDGILLLNKEYAGFNILKEHFPKVMKKKDKQLKKEIKASQALKNKTDWQNVYYAMLQIEAERRKKKGVK